MNSIAGPPLPAKLVTSAAKALQHSFEDNINATKSQSLASYADKIKGLNVSTARSLIPSSADIRINVGELQDIEAEISVVLMYVKKLFTYLYTVVNFL